MHKGQRSLKVLLHPADLADFDQWLQRRGDTVALKAWSQTEQPEVLQSLSDAVANGVSEEVVLVPRAQLASLKPSAYVIGRGYRLDLVRAPVLTLHTSFFDGRVLRHGGLGADIGYWGFRDGKHEWVDKPREVALWVDAIISRVRRYCVTRHGTYYVGPHALRWKNEGGGMFAVL